MKPEHHYTHYTKINSKWMKAVNVRQESIKILGRSIGNKRFGLTHCNILQDTYLRPREVKAK